MSEDKKRIFIAINLPDQVKQELVQYISKIKKINSSHNFKYVKPQGMHLTLHFLGYLTDEQINQTKVALAKATQDKNKFYLETNQLDGFPNLNRSRVVYIDCIGNIEQALNIQNSIELELEKLDLETENRPWKAHLTLCRIKNNERFKLPDFEPPKLEFEVKAIDLMKSKLTSRGPEYTVLESFDLK